MRLFLIFSCLQYVTRIIFIMISLIKVCCTMKNNIFNFVLCHSRNRSSYVISHRIRFYVLPLQYELEFLKNCVSQFSCEIRHKIKLYALFLSFNNNKLNFIFSLLFMVFRNVVKVSVIEFGCAYFLCLYLIFAWYLWKLLWYQSWS